MDGRTGRWMDSIKISIAESCKGEEVAVSPDKDWANRTGIMRVIFFNHLTPNKTVMPQSHGCYRKRNRM